MPEGLIFLALLMAATLRRSSQSWNQQATQSILNTIAADGGQGDTFRLTAPEAKVSAQSGSTYSGANQTQDGHIVQVGNINANVVHIGEAVTNPAREYP